jgi:hypothetical protein
VFLSQTWDFERWVASIHDDGAVADIKSALGGVHLCLTTASGSPLLDMPGLAILQPARADAAKSPTNCVVGGGNFSHMTCVCWEAPHAPAIQYRGQHLFLFEHAMPKPGFSADLGRCIEVVTHKRGFEYAISADFHHAHGGAYIADDAPCDEIITCVLFNMEHDIANLRRLRAHWASTALGVATVQADDLHHLASMPGLPASVTDDAQRSWWAADAFEAADAAGAVTFDEQSGGASIQLGWRARVQVSDEAVEGYYPLRLRQRDLQKAEAVGPLVAGVAPVLQKAASAFASKATWAYEAMHTFCGLGDPTTKGALAYPPRHLQTASVAAPFMAFLSLVVRLKGPPGPDARAYDHAVLDGTVGIHSDTEDCSLGVIVSMAVASRRLECGCGAMSLAAARTMHQSAWKRLRVALRLRGGAGAAFSNRERSARRRENERRAQQGQPRLPRGLWDANFGPGLPAYAAAVSAAFGDYTRYTMAGYISISYASIWARTGPA